MTNTHKESRGRIAWPVLPAFGAGQAIGLYGGSFNPVHDGHVHVSDIALRAFRLDRLWWLVTPGNPLKSGRGLAPLEDRLHAARHLADDPRIAVLSIEADIGVSRTLSTVRWLKRRAPSARFVWIMGADNLAGFHRWHGWRDIASELPMGIIDRPGYGLAATNSPAAQTFAGARLDEVDAPLIAAMRPPAWVFLRRQLNAQSSSAIRGGGKAPE